MAQEFKSILNILVKDKTTTASYNFSAVIMTICLINKQQELLNLKFCQLNAIFLTKVLHPPLVFFIGASAVCTCLQPAVVARGTLLEGPGHTFVVTITSPSTLRHTALPGDTSRHVTAPAQVLSLPDLAWPKSKGGN